MEFLQLVVSLAILLVLLAILAMIHKKKMSYLGVLQRFQPQDDITTVLPIPLGAATCTHDWEKLAEHVLEMPHEKKVVLILSCRHCGSIDKTVQVTSPEPKGKEECRHQWDKQKSVKLDSAYEQMLKSISVKQSYGKAKIDTDKKINLDLNKAPAWMFRKAYVCEWVCTLCGEVHTTLASNFDVDSEDEEDDFDEEEET
jgi:hypothetical protein